MYQKKRTTSQVEELWDEWLLLARTQATNWINALKRGRGDLYGPEEYDRMEEQYLRTLLDPWNYSWVTFRDAKLGKIERQKQAKTSKKRKPKA